MTSDGSPSAVAAVEHSNTIAGPSSHERSVASSALRQKSTSFDSADTDTDPTLQFPLESQPSFRLDEGYSEDATSVDERQAGNFESSGCFSTATEEDTQQDFASQEGDVELPAWMMALNDELREELAYKLVRSLPTSRIANIVDRLIPVLHIDFITVLPTELSLQILSYLPPKSLIHASLTNKTWRKFAMEPRLWKGLYRSQGWSLGEEEALGFEREMRGEGKRKQQPAEGLFKNRTMAGFMGAASPMGSVFGVMSNAATAGSDRGNDSLPYQQPTPPTSFSTPHPEDDEMYPSPHIPQRAAASPLLAYPAHEPAIASSLTTYGLTHPRLNWAYIFKNRKKLEENWRHNRYTPVQIPHPDWREEGHSECIYTIQYSQKYMLSGSRDRSIKVWNMRTRRLIRNLMGHEGSVLCLQFDESPEEDVIFSGSSDTNVIQWKFSTGERLKTINNAHSESVLNLRFNKKYIVTCSKDRYVKVWSRQSLQPHQPEYAAAVHQINIGANRLIDPGSIDMFASLHGKKANNLPPLTIIHTLSGHSAAVNAIQLLDEEVVSASGDRLIKLWDLKTGQCAKTFVGHDKGIACIQYDGHQIVSGSSDRSIRVFDKESQAEVARLVGHAGLVRTVQSGGPNNSRIVSGGYDETIRVWRKEHENGDLDDGDNAGPYGQLEEGSEWKTTGILRHIEEMPGANAHRPGEARHGLPAPHTHGHGYGGHNTLGGQAPAPAAPNQHGQANWPGWNNGTAALNAAQQAFAVQHPPAAAPAVAAAAGQPFAWAGPPQTIPAPPPPAQPAAALAASQNQNKVFKLQFDARFVWCCSQDTRLVGWDFANSDQDIIEASRFF